jgi:hypothetical protein
VPNNPRTSPLEKVPAEALRGQWEELQTRRGVGQRITKGVHVFDSYLETYRGMGEAAESFNKEYGFPGEGALGEENDRIVVSLLASMFALPEAKKKKKKKGAQ